MRPGSAACTLFRACIPKALEKFLHRRRSGHVFFIRDFVNHFHKVFRLPWIKSRLLKESLVEPFTDVEMSSVIVSATMVSAPYSYRSY